MRPHPRIRKTVKWGGLALCLLLAGVWVRSECVHEGYLWETQMVVWARGTVIFVRYRGNPAWLGHFALPTNSGPPRAWLPSFSFDAWQSSFFVPMWIPLAPTLLATAAAWRLDALARRRARAGVCAKCGYDRAGLAASAVCPECGAVP